MWSGTEDDLPLQRVYRWERKRAERIFLTQPYDHGKVRDWTWAQAVGDARRMAAYLQAQNWEPGSRIGILSKNCAWWIMADLAIWMAGHVSVPVYPSLKAESARDILTHSDSKACFIGPTDERETAKLGIPEGVLCIYFPNANPCHQPSWDAIMAGYSPVAGNPTRPADDIATVIYTSGTTGAPKGAMHRFASFSFLAERVKQALGLTSGDRVLSYLPLAHIVERTGFEGPCLIVGMNMFFTEGLDTFVTDLQRARPTIFLSVPRLLAKFQAGVFAKIPKQKLDRLFRAPILNRYIKKKILRQLGLDSVRHARCGSAPLPVEHLLWYRKLGLELAEGFGTTEILITHLALPGAVRPGYVGAPFEGVETRLTPEGELLVRSPMNMAGYYKDPAGTRNSFTDDGFFRTGDLVQMDPDGQIKIVGRLKEQFKTSKGKYVVPAPIESRLCNNPAIEACCIVGGGLPCPFAVVLLAPEARERCSDRAAKLALEDSLKRELEAVNAQLDAHERVAFIAIAEGPWTVATGVVTPTLKIKRAVIEARYQSLFDEWQREKTPVIWESAAVVRTQRASLTG
jgi:long-chain acyl-CoA synthetase